MWYIVIALRPLSRSAAPATTANTFGFNTPLKLGIRMIRDCLGTPLLSHALLIKIPRGSAMLAYIHAINYKTLTMQHTLASIVIPKWFNDTRLLHFN